MSKHEIALPKIGDKIPRERFFVSDMNVRKGHPFGDSEADKNLIQDLRRAKNNKPVHPFKARPEGDGYGVYAGRRKLLALKMLRKEMVIGVHGVVEHVTDEEAISASWTENRTELQEEMDPISYAEGLQKVLSFSPLSLRKWAEAHNMKHTTLVERLKVLDLNPKMQEVTAKGLIYFTDALTVARMKLGTEKQDELAGLVETAGVDAFKSEVERLRGGKGKRGIPGGKFFVWRIMWDRRYPRDIEDRKKLHQMAVAQDMEDNEYSKKVLRIWLRMPEKTREEFLKLAAA